MDDKEVNACDIGLAMLQGNMVGRKTALVKHMLRYWARENAVNGDLPGQSRQAMTIKAANQILRPTLATFM